MVLYIGDSSEFKELEYKVTGFRCDWVTDYRSFSDRGSVQRYFWYSDKFTDHRFTDDTFM